MCVGSKPKTPAPQTPPPPPKPADIEQGIDNKKKRGLGRQRLKLSREEGKKTGLNLPNT